MSQKKGFTLIELLLVIALISILSVAGLAAYQIQTKNFKIDKTALQMQQWLQAGLAFYADCGQWPDPNKDPQVMDEMMGEQPISVEACPRLKKPMWRAYMPLYADINGPWPNKYTIAVGTQQYNGLFEVSTYLPPFSEHPFTEWVPALNMATAIAGRLPNAIGSVDHQRQPPQALVTAYVGVPGSNNNQTGHAIILDMQIVQSKHRSNLIKPTLSDCPVGTTPAVLTSFAHLQAGDDQTGSHRGVYTARVSYSTDRAGYITPLVTINSSCAPHNYNCGDTDTDNGQALIITACLPQHKQVISTSPLGNNTLTPLLRY